MRTLPHLILLQSWRRAIDCRLASRLYEQEGSQSEPRTHSKRGRTQPQVCCNCVRAGFLGSCSLLDDDLQHLSACRSRSCQQRLANFSRRGYFRHHRWTGESPDDSFATLLMLSTMVRPHRPTTTAITPPPPPPTTTTATTTTTTTTTTTADGGRQGDGLTDVTVHNNDHYPIRHNFLLQQGLPHWCRHRLHYCRGR